MFASLLAGSACGLSVLVGDRASAAGPAADRSDLFRRLIGEGISVTPRRTVALAPPVFRPDASSDDRRAQLRELASPHAWQRFRRDSVVAPVAIDLEYLRDPDGSRVGHRVGVAFVVHADLETLRDRDAMGKLFGGQREAAEESDAYRGAAISGETLRELGIEFEPDRETFGWVELTLLERIILHGVIRSQRSESPDRLTVCWILDERFTDASIEEPRYRNWWLKLRRDELGRERRGQRRAYAGAGGYITAARLPELPGASLVEARLVVHEPPQWFGGSNLLRSKLPLVIQESVRTFRRQLSGTSQQ